MVFMIEVKKKKTGGKQNNNELLIIFHDPSDRGIKQYLPGGKQIDEKHIVGDLHDFYINDPKFRGRNNQNIVFGGGKTYLLQMTAFHNQETRGGAFVLTAATNSKESPRDPFPRPQRTTYGKSKPEETQNEGSSVRNLNKIPSQIRYRKKGGYH